MFDVIIFFELRTIQQKTVKPTYLCPLGARKLAEGWKDMLCVTGVYLRDETRFLHLNVSRLSICSSCYRCNRSMLLKVTLPSINTIL